MALLGDDGRGYELARKLEDCGVWRTWLGDSSYSNFVPFLNSPSTWHAFMRLEVSKSRAQIQLQLRVRALLFDKASISLFLRSNSTSTTNSSSSSLVVSKLNPTYLQLHGDDVYFTLENSVSDGVQQRDVAVSSHTASSKIQSKAPLSTGSRYGEYEDNITQRLRTEELPETWYNQFIEKYRSKIPYKLSLGDRESDKRTSEAMSAYLKLLEKHKKRRIAYKEDQYIGHGMENVSHMQPNSMLDGSNSIDDESYFFPETMFSLNCVPDSALLATSRDEDNQKVEVYGVLDTLPRIMCRSPVMIERLGIRPEYLGMDHGGSIYRGKRGAGGIKKSLSQEQASKLSQKVLARMLTSLGFEGATEAPIEVFSQLMSCHMSKLGHVLKVLADSYKKQCSAIELLKMFVQTMGYSNFGSLAEHVKDNSRNFVQQNQQQVNMMQSQLQAQQQSSLRLPQQVRQQMNPHMQQFVHSQNLAFQQQQQQQLERLRRRQSATPRPAMEMDKDRPPVQVKIENQSDLPMDGNVYNNFNNRHPQLQFRQQQMAAALSNLAMSNVHTQSNNQFRQMASVQVPQVQTQNMGVTRAPPVKVEGFQELMGGGQDSEETRLTSPSSKT